MKIKQSELIRISINNEAGVRRLAKWLKLNSENELSEVLKELFSTGYFPADNQWGSNPSGFRGRVK